MTKPITVGLAEFEIRNEFGVYKIYAGGYGRPVRMVGTLVDGVQASVLGALVKRGIEDAVGAQAAPAAAPPDPS
jgi:hypothetical protein